MKEKEKILKKATSNNGVAFYSQNFHLKIYSNN